MLKFLSALIVTLFLFTLILPIKQVHASGTFQFNWGSNGSSNGQFNYPYGVAVDSNGNVYVGDFNDSRIQKFDATGNYISTFSSSPSINFAGGAAFDSSGNIYFPGAESEQIFEYSPSGSLINHFGTGGSGTGQLNGPYQVALDSSNNIYVTNLFNNDVVKFTNGGSYLTQWSISSPEGIAYSPYNGNLYVSSSSNNNIVEYNTSGTQIASFGSYGSSNGQLNSPANLAVASNGDVLVTDPFNYRVDIFSPTGTFLDYVGTGTNGSSNGQIANSYGVAVNNASGNIYVADSGNYRIDVFSDSNIAGSSTPNAPSNLSPTLNTSGEWISNNQPSFSFDIGDPTLSNSVKYEIQISNSSNFSSPIVDYTSPLYSQSTTSTPETFTVGQSVGSGNYIAGSSGQKLSDGSYYVRLRTINSLGAFSAYTLVNSGSIAFKLDTASPTVPGTPTTITPTFNTSPEWTWTASTDSGSGLATNPYLIEWSQNSTFSSGVSSTSSSTNSVILPSNLTPGTWYVRVAALDNAGNMSVYSSAGSVDIQTQISQTIGSSSSTITNVQPKQNSTLSVTTSDSDITSTAISNNSSNSGQQSIILNKYQSFLNGTGKQFNVSNNQKIYYIVNGKTYTIYVDNVNADNIIFSIDSNQDSFNTLKTGQSFQLAIGSDKGPNLKLTLLGIQNGLALISFAKINSPSVNVKLSNKTQGSVSLYWIVVMIAIIIASVWLILKFKKTSKNNN